MQKSIWIGFFYDKRFTFDFFQSRHLTPNRFGLKPGLPGKGLPYIGHMHLVTKKPHGVGKSWLNLELLIQKYLKGEDKLFRMNSGMFNPEGDGRFVILLDPNDVEKAHKNEGKYPSR